MSANKLPIKLGKEPLLDVVCGVNFQSSAPAEAFLPGLIMQKMTGRQLKFESLGIAHIPQAVREQDSTLQNAPLMSIKVDDQFIILIASKWLGVGCIMPYSGWAKFKEMICAAFSVLRDAPFATLVERHSLKYVDFIQSGDKSLTRFNVDLQVAGKAVSNQATQLRTELTEAPFLHAISLLSDAMVRRPDESIMRGSVVEVDTHRIESLAIADFLNNLESLLDQLHDSNKSLFFSLLSKEGLDELEPVYE